MFKRAHKQHLHLGGRQERKHALDGPRRRREARAGRVATYSRQDQGVDLLPQRQQSELRVVRRLEGQPAVQDEVRPLQRAPQRPPEQAERRR